MIWWTRRKKREKTRDLDQYLAEQRAAAEAVHDDARQQVEETRSLQAESAKVSAQGRRILERNGFTRLMTHVLRGVQEDGQ